MTANDPNIATASMHAEAAGSSITYLVQVTLNARRLYDWTRMAGIAGDQDYAIHGALRAAFGDLSPQPWCTRPGPSLTVLGYSDADADALRRSADLYAEPGLSEAIVDLKTKPMPRLPSGTIVGFQVRVRPIARRRNPLTGGAFEQDVAIGADPEDRADAYRNWLGKQFLGCAEVIRAEVEKFQLVRSSRKTDGVVKRAPGWHPEATLSGVLRVKDAELFADRLRRGIGRHRAFGYGALLLRPPRGH
jgi:CRISPR system Cascade subunit CasE